MLQSFDTMPVNAGVLCKGSGATPETEEIPSADELAAEVEQFLRDQGD